MANRRIDGALLKIAEVKYVKILGESTIKIWQFIGLELVKINQN
ncbi:hypothetical protein CWATWH0401_4092 [Crocosphaera watsonii WH 0401]|uniref:Uncharacterized protein n=1 Tax=Crocosphaera watsonii WH 0401 TaxID=555881 RepID=T2J8Z1_CROWT|nr:hypothetical protein CWATWH0401_4092 [Crocosphaera watsonii WH 0401]